MKNILYVLSGLILTCLSFTNLFAQDWEQTTLDYGSHELENPERDGFKCLTISYKEGNKETNLFKSEAKFNVIFFSKDNINTALDNCDCVGLKIQSGSFNDRTCLILQAVTKDGYAVTSRLSYVGIGTKSQNPKNEIDSIMIQKCLDNDIKNFIVYISKEAIDTLLANADGIHIRPGSRMYLPKDSAVVKPYTTFLFCPAKITNEESYGINKTPQFTKSLLACPYICDFVPNLKKR